MKVVMGARAETEPEAECHGQKRGVATALVIIEQKRTAAHAAVPKLRNCLPLAPHSASSSNPVCTRGRDSCSNQPQVSLAI